AIYVTGGIGGNDRSANVAYRYDMVTRAFTPIASMLYGVAFHGLAVSGPNSRLYVTGGTRGSGPVSSAQIFAPPYASGLAARAGGPYSAQPNALVVVDASTTLNPSGVWLTYTW